MALGARIALNTCARVQTSIVKRTPTAPRSPQHGHPLDARTAQVLLQVGSVAVVVPAICALCDSPAYCDTCWREAGTGRVTVREIKNIFATGAKKPGCATGFESNKKSSTVPGRSCYLGKEKREIENTTFYADSGAQLKDRIFPSGLNI